MPATRRTSTANQDKTAIKSAGTGDAATAIKKRTSTPRKPATKSKGKKGRKAAPAVQEEEEDDEDDEEEDSEGDDAYQAKGGKKGKGSAQGSFGMFALRPGPGVTNNSSGGDYGQSSTSSHYNQRRLGNMGPPLAPLNQVEPNVPSFHENTRQYAGKRKRDEPLPSNEIGMPFPAHAQQQTAVQYQQQAHAFWQHPAGITPQHVQQQQQLVHGYRPAQETPMPFQKPQQHQSFSYDPQITISALDPSLFPPAQNTDATAIIRQNKQLEQRLVIAEREVMRLRNLPAKPDNVGMRSTEKGDLVIDQAAAQSYIAVIGTVYCHVLGTKADFIRESAIRAAIASFRETENKLLEKKRLAVARSMQQNVSGASRSRNSLGSSTSADARLNWAALDAEFEDARLNLLKSVRDTANTVELRSAFDSYCYPFIRNIADQCGYKRLGAWATPLAANTSRPIATNAVNVRNSTSADTSLSSNGANVSIEPGRDASSSGGKSRASHDASLTGGQHTSMSDAQPKRGIRADPANDVGLDESLSAHTREINGSEISQTANPLDEGEAADLDQSTPDINPHRTGNPLVLISGFDTSAPIATSSPLTRGEVDDNSASHGHGGRHSSVPEILAEMDDQGDFGPGTLPAYDTRPQTLAGYIATQPLSPSTSLRETRATSV